jgi:hypothetical protein
VVFLAGWGENGKVLGVSTPLQCRNCNNLRPHNVLEKTKKVTVFLVPVAKWNYTYYLLCPICNRDIQLENKESALKIIAEGLGGIRD